MGTILASATIARARIKLLDPDQTVWDDAELLADYNASVRLIALYKPSVSVVVAPFALAAGARQNTPGDFMSVKSNAAGKAVVQVDMDDMDHCRPDWRNDAAGPTLNWMADKRQPSYFWVYPPAVAAASVELIQATAPAPVLASAACPLGDEYEEVIFWLILAHAYSKNTVRGDLQKTAAFLGLATQALGLKRQMQIEQLPIPAAQEQRAN